MYKKSQKKETTFVLNILHIFHFYFNNALQQMF